VGEADCFADFETGAGLGDGDASLEVGVEAAGCEEEVGAELYVVR